MNSSPRWMDEMWWFELTRQFLQESSGVPSLSWVGLASKENIPGGFLFPLPQIVVKQNSSPSVLHVFGFLFLVYWSLIQLFKVWFLSSHWIGLVFYTFFAFVASSALSSPPFFVSMLISRESFSLLISLCFQCREGHIICEECKANPALKVCPSISWLPYSTDLYLDFHLLHHVVVFHDKAWRTQQGNLLPIHAHSNFLLTLRLSRFRTL